MLELEHVSKSFATVRAVDDISLVIKAGEIFGLIGPNGAGKTTTIRMIAGILQPDSGSIRFNGMPIDENMKNRMGYLPEERGLYKKNKLMDTIVYFGSLKGMTPDQVREKARPWLERFGLAKYANRKLEELSKGNQQKIQFLISTLHDPDLLILDELFAGLDPLNQEMMNEWLHDMKRGGKVILFSTHVMEQAENICDRLCMINKGRVVLEGSPDSIRKQHTRDTIRIEFAGDGSFLASLPGVRNAVFSDSAVELELEPGTDLNAILARAIREIEISRFERIVPSLHQIFIDVVGDSNPVKETTPEPVRPVMAATDPAAKRLFLSGLFLLSFGIIAGVIAVTRTPGIEDFIAPVALTAAGIVRFFQYRRRKKKLAGGTHR